MVPKLIPLALLCCSCAGSLEQARLEGVAARRGLPPGAVGSAPSERCQSLDDTHRYAGGAATTAAFLAGAEGLATVPVEDSNARMWLALGIAVTGAAAAGAWWVAEDAEYRWNMECIP